MAKKLSKKANSRIEEVKSPNKGVNSIKLKTKKKSGVSFARRLFFGRRSSKNDFPWVKAYSLLTLAAITTIATVLGGLFLINSRNSAKAGSIPVDLYPGQTAEFTIQYFDNGDEALKNGLLEIYIGDELSLDSNSLKDSFNGGSEFQVISSVVTTTVGGFGYHIQYLPGSANNPNSPSGTNVAADLPFGFTGEFTFQATLKSDVLDRGWQIGDTMDPVVDKQGVYSFVSGDNLTNSYSDTQQIRIVGDPNSSSSSSSSLTTSSSSSINSVSSSVSSSSVSSSSSSSSLTTSSSSSINSVSSSVSSSSVSSSSSNSSSSQQPIDTTLGCLTSENTNHFGFISRNGEGVDWDQETEFNVAYPENQKFKDGKVTFFWDKIAKPDGTSIPNSSTVTFDLYRYGKDEKLRTYTTTASNGYAQVEFPAEEQSVNYYTVVARATNSGQSIKCVNRLVLVVGGNGSRPDPNAGGSSGIQN